MIFEHSMASNRLIGQDRKDRSPAPMSVWDWQNYPRWRDELWPLLEDIVPNAVRDRLISDPPRHIVSDNLQWLESELFVATGEFVDVRTLLTDRISERYGFLRAVHGTRLENLSTVYSAGLLPLDPRTIQHRAREIFLTGEIAEISEARFQEAIAAIETETREGRVFFEANERMFLEDCGHYLHYGSEYLLGIADGLGAHRDYRQILKSYGEPTVFVCDVPLELIPEAIKREFTGMALEAIFSQLVFGDYPEIADTGGAGFCIHSVLPPANIVGHYHPLNIRDPLC